MIALYNGVSGLAAQQQAVDVIANNIANINTVGYKASRVTFMDALSNTLRGASTSGTNPVQVGLGVAVAGIDANMTQGNLQSTSRPTDLALEGQGFFILGGGGSTAYTRAGNFGLDATNRLVSLVNGMAVLGWQADPITGEVDNSTTVGPDSSISIPLGTMARARATEHVVYQSNLDANTAVGGTVSTSFSVYDSLGNDHQIQLDFTKSGANAWTWRLTSPDIDPAAAPLTGNITFDANGQCLLPNIACSLTLANANGAVNPLAFSVNTESVTQLAGDATIRAVSQDGLELGWLESFSIDQNGLITGGFSNGMTQALGQVAVATFNNPAGLERTGSSMYTPSANSGTPSISAPGRGGAGKVAGGYLELSNVNLADEFANLIVTQRGFQASSRIISTADEMLQDLVTLKR